MNPRTQSPSSRPLDRLAPAPDRWRWMALSGVAAGSAAATSAAFAGVVQISQVSNEVTSSADNLRADLTGDGEDDLMGLAASYGPSSFLTDSSSYYGRINRAYARFDGGSLGEARFVQWSPASNTSSITSSGYGNWVDGNWSDEKAGQSGLIPVTFTDARINGGQPTNGLLEVRAFSTSPTEHTVRLVRLVFDDASTAAPAGVVAGGSNPEFRATIYAERTAHAASVSNLSKKISTANKKLKAANKKLKKARKLGQAAKAKNLQRTAKKLKKQLKSLRSQLSRLRANPI